MSRSITIFYSWQSDCERKHNHYFIGDSLKAAIKTLSSSGMIGGIDVSYRIDSDTRNCKGTVDIAAAILDKIDQSDIFLCDLTTVNQGSRKYRKMPNPNVAIELGYAASLLGWESIICVFNRAYGKMPEDLPFDVCTRRVIPYQFDGTGKAAKLKDLADTLASSIRSVATIQTAPILPPSPRDFRKEKARRDEQTLRTVLKQFHFPSLDVFLDRALDGVIVEQIFYFWEGFDAYMQSSSFHVYNTQLSALIGDFYQAMSRCFSFDHRFVPITGGYIFSDAERRFEVAEWESDRAAFGQAIVAANAAWCALLAYTREHYPRLDLAEISKVAGEAYNAYHRRPSIIGQPENDNTPGKADLCSQEGA